jgi:two-component system OmpR family sensor kinase
VLERARERFARRAGASGRSLTVDCGDGLRASLDPLRVEQAVGNLVDNALRHGAGTVVIAARTIDGGAVEISVADEGAGIPDDLAARAFERFTRADDARTRDGSGLGLAIVAAIVGSHGGSVRVNATEGGGATLVVSLPLRDDSQEASHGDGVSEDEVSEDLGTRDDGPERGGSGGGQVIHI